MSQEVQRIIHKVSNMKSGGVKETKKRVHRVTSEQTSKINFTMGQANMGFPTDGIRGRNKKR